MSRPVTLVDLLTRAGSHEDAGLRLLDRHGRTTWLSWPAIRSRALEVAGGLQAAGVGPGDRVALVFPTGTDFFDAFFGTLVAGAVPVPLYPPSHLGRMDEYVRRTSAMLSSVEAALVVADARVKRLFGEVLRIGKPRLGAVTLGDLRFDGSPRAVTVKPDHLGLIQFSSGTTASPKPVALSHAALVTQAQLLNAFWPDTPEVRHSGVSWLPLYHDMGLVGMIFTALERPAVVTLIPPEVFVTRPLTWLRAISDFRATVSAAPTFGYGHCVNRIRDEELEGLDLSSWRVALCGGEAVVPAVLRRFAARFAGCGLRSEALTPVYGLAEASLAVTFSDLHHQFATTSFRANTLAPGHRAVPDPSGLESVSVGRPLPGFDIRISLGPGVAAPEGVVGRIECRGPSLMDGYFRQPDATSRTIRDGWLDTGDLGLVLDGELYLSGRAKDLLIVRGRNHSPEEVERAVADVPGVRAGRVVAASWVPEGAEAEQLLLLVEARGWVERTRFAALAQACREAVISATGLTPDRVVVVEAGALPRTSSGKMRRGEAVARYIAGRLSAPRRVTPWSVVRYLARSWAAARRWRARREEVSAA